MEIQGEDLQKTLHAVASVSLHLDELRSFRSDIVIIILCDRSGQLMLEDKMK